VRDDPTTGAQPTQHVSRETSVVAAAAIFGDRLPVAERFAFLLRTVAIERGLIGPREASRLWARHLLNCAALSRAIPPNSSLVDVGSGAGLPGLVLALLREDLRVALVEPMQRRADFLAEAVSQLALPNVVIHRARAEQMRDERAGIVTARAVAPLARLAGWCLPLVVPGGALLAIKGAAAATELSAAEPTLRSLGAAHWAVESLWAGEQMPATIVVRVVMGEAAPTQGPSRSHRHADAATERRRTSPGRRRRTS